MRTSRRRMSGTLQAVPRPLLEVGEAMNTIAPLAGLGGDQFRVRRLSGEVGAARP
ncbi:MAG TPA: hypothetical protein VEL05_11955 [Candidatus Acidoferrum sp.]|nr:hypothetical protein [Candidatus Acidoferrum sp.]